jgi:hypothetical protein
MHMDGKLVQRYGRKYYFTNITYRKEANILWPESELFFPHNLLQCVSILVYEPGYKYFGGAS